MRSLHTTKYPSNIKKNLIQNPLQTDPRTSPAIPSDLENNQHRTTKNKQNSHPAHITDIANEHPLLDRNHT